jgi:hypothetical protein
MSDSSDLKALKARFDDEYVKSLSTSSSGRIGGEVRRIEDMIKGRVMADSAEKLAAKLIDACVFKNAVRAYDVMSDNDKQMAATFLEIEQDELTPYHLTSLIKTEVLHAMIQTEGVNNYSDFVQKKGFKKLVLFILAVGNTIVNDAKKNHAT